ncbi:hypothetical protein ACFE04_021272 [Oxalis oulophora]
MVASLFFLQTKYEALLINGKDNGYPASYKEMWPLGRFIRPVEHIDCELNLNDSSSRRSRTFLSSVPLDLNKNLNVVIPQECPHQWFLAFRDSKVPEVWLLVIAQLHNLVKLVASLFFLQTKYEALLINGKDNGYPASYREMWPLGRFIRPVEVMILEKCHLLEIKQRKS